MTQQPANVDNIVKATVVLHNFMRSVRPADDPATLVGEDADLGTTDGLRDMDVPARGNTSLTAQDVRLAFTQFFMGPGRIPLQWDVCAVREP